MATSTSTPAPTLPATQPAVHLNTTTNALSYTPSAPVAAPSSTAHTIAVHSTAITNGELTWGPFVHWPEHHIPGFDVSGTIVSPVPGSPFAVGDKVFGRIGADREGAAAKYTTLLPSEAARMPKGLSMEEAASIPMSALTAWQALFEKGGLCGEYTPERVPHVDEAGNVVGGQAAGKRVLILGAAGGVGLMAVQFAKLAGAWVAGTASARNAKYLKELGIDEVIDYTQTSVEAWISGDEARKFDVVFDCVGGKSMLDGWTAVKKGSVFVSVVIGFREPEGGKPEGVRSEWFVMDSRGSELEGIGKFIEKGLVKGAVDSVWALEDFEKAFAKTATGHARGKVVIRVVEQE